MSTETDAALPEGWAPALFGDLAAEMQTGFACGTNNRDGTGIPHLRPMNVNDLGRIDLGDVKSVPKAEADRDERLLRKGDVLFNNTNSPELVGKTAYYDLDEALAFSNHMTRVRFREGVIPQFWAMYLHQKWREKFFQNTCNNHVSQASVSRTALSELSVNLPPTAEQFRILSAVERVLARLSSARERLGRVLNTVTQLREAVLEAACSGRLSGEAMEEGLPSGWSQSPVRALLAEPLANGRSVPDALTGFPVLRLNAIRNGRVSLKERKVGRWTREEAFRYLVKKGDFLVARGNGSLSLVGRGGLVNDEPDEVAYPDTLIRVRVKSAVCLPKYLAIIWDSRTVRDQIESVARTSAGIHKISQPDIENVSIPVPSVGVQAAIVQRVGGLFALAASTEQRAKSALRRVELLAQAVLAKAFRGELVPTEAELARRDNRSYETASELLARLAAKPNGAPKRTRTRKTGQKAAPSDGDALHLVE